MKEHTPVSIKLEIRAGHLKHIEACHSERRLIGSLRSETLRTQDAVFQVDDKLGSFWQFLPMPPNMRQGKDVSSNYQYRQCLQGNFFPGRGNFYMVVQPMLSTGNNFGCTSFILGLYKLIEGGKFDHVRRLVRQTDGGSDNVGWVTFAVHSMLITEGTLDLLDWVRLRPGHSHNEADANHRKVLQAFYPKGNNGQGCESPLQFHQRLVDALRTLNGGLEMLWQLSNFDFEAWMKGCMSSQFAGFRDERFWRFEYDEAASDHFYVKVTYKTNLDDKATAKMDEWKPHIDAPLGSMREMVTDPKGLRFMASYPDMRTAPRYEPWKRASVVEQQQQQQPGDAPCTGRGGSAGGEAQTAGA